MKLLIVSFLAVLACPIATCLEDKQVTHFSIAEKKSAIKSSVKTWVSPASNGNTNKKEYVFLSDESGRVIIIDARSYDVILSYVLPDIANTSIVITGETLYSIDGKNGIILNTNIKNIMTGENINWEHVGSFAKEDNYARNSAVADGSNIYFVTYSGKLYNYDTILQGVNKLGDIQISDAHASLVVVNNVLYIHKKKDLYTFDGTNTNKLQLTLDGYKYYIGLFNLANKVCVVGGSSSLNLKDPVPCYDPVESSWFISGYLNNGRRYPAVARTESGICVFGGYIDYPPEYVKRSEILNYETRRWTYIPHPLNAELRYAQAATFYF